MSGSASKDMKDEVEDDSDDSSEEPSAKRTKLAHCQTSDVEDGTEVLNSAFQSSASLPKQIEGVCEANDLPFERQKWNTNEEVYAILSATDMHESWEKQEIMTRPPSGTMLLYNCKKVTYWKDGYFWTMRKDGLTTKEDCMKISVQGIECLYGSFVYSAIIPTFHRRCYWRLQFNKGDLKYTSYDANLLELYKAKPYNDIVIMMHIRRMNPELVLVHYLNVTLINDSQICLPPSLQVDCKDWSHDDLVSQLRPMFAGVKQLETARTASNESVEDAIESFVKRYLGKSASPSVSNPVQLTASAMPQRTVETLRNTSEQKMASSLAQGTMHNQPLQLIYGQNILPDAASVLFGSQTVCEPNSNTTVLTGMLHQAPIEGVSKVENTNLSAFQQRWQSPEYKNFLKVIESLSCLRDGLGPLCVHVMREFQAEVLIKHNIEPQECKKVTCRAKHIKNGKLQTECTERCSVLLQEILNAHGSSKAPNSIYWNNAEVGKWSTDEWQVAKTYMGRGQKVENSGPEKSDSVSLLQLLTNCKRFHIYISSADVDKVISKRNAAMHTYSLGFTDDQMQETLDVSLRFLSKLLVNISQNKDIEMGKEALQTAIQNLTELRNLNFDVFFENKQTSPNQAEIKIIKEIIYNHENDLSSTESEEKIDEMKRVVPLLKMLNKNKDLLREVEDGYDNLVSFFNVDEAGMTAATATMTVAQEELSYLNEEIRMLPYKPQIQQRASVANEKEALTSFLERKSITEMPKYRQWLDVARNDRWWWASMSLLIGNEMKTFLSSQSYRRIVSAQNSAAGEGLKFLRTHEELFTDVPGLE